MGYGRGALGVGDGGGVVCAGRWSSAAAARGGVAGVARVRWVRGALARVSAGAVWRGRCRVAGIATGGRAVPRGGVVSVPRGAACLMAITTTTSIKGACGVATRWLRHP